MNKRGPGPAFEQEPHVPEAVLDELLAAFGGAPDTAATAAVDLEDPAIDALLGLDHSPTDAVDESSAAPERTGDEVHQDVPDPPPAASSAHSPGRPARQTVVIGDGDGLPDAVHLDEDAEDRLRATHGDAADPHDTQRGTILIGDDDDPTQTAGIPTATGPASIDPRIRARRMAVRRGQGRKRLRWTLAITGVLLVAVGILAALGSSLFAIERDQVDVDGAVYTDPARLQAVIDELVGTPVLTADTEKAERELETIPWVEDARVRTRFPSGAHIELRERVPLATFQGADSRWRVIDSEGRVLDVIAGQPLAYMPITGAVPGPDIVAGGFAGVIYARAAQVVSALTPEIRSRTEAVGVSGDGAAGELTLEFAAGTIVRLGEPDDLQQKLARLQTVLLRQDGEQPDEIDVSTADVSVR